MVLFFDKVAILGTGLIGASFALALREKELCRNICGFGRKEENLKRAKERGIIDEYSLDAAKACEEADLVLFAVPIGLFGDIAAKIKGVLKRGAIITDVGSVKGRLVYELESLMPQGVFYIGSHPIAGSDKSGIDDAKPDLFYNAKCIITPTERTNEPAKDKLISLWETLGANAELMDPMKHDEIYAVVSHFPHVVAYAIVNAVGEIDSKYIEYAGRGFKDATRIALSSPEIWRDISLFNRENIGKVMDVFRKELDKLEDMLKSSDASKLEAQFTKAQSLRKRLK